ncbi:MAG: HigA family addiction module antidote protein [Rhizobiales bacterium]|nr:HigA family addiction module antidote protein [Hyphomicrobiales bacterium]MDQ3559314.1 HigA family addiction module antitoxin [Pseudomonadota bacterium]
MIRMAQPAHPGRIVKTEIIEAHGLSVTEAARVLGVSRPALSALLNGRASLSAVMGLRIEKAFGVKMDTLLRIQTAFDIAEARKTESDLNVSRYVARDGHSTNEPFSG